MSPPLNIHGEGVENDIKFLRIHTTKLTRGFSSLKLGQTSIQAPGEPLHTQPTQGPDQNYVKCQCVYMCVYLTCPLPKRAGPAPCDEPCGSRSSSHRRFACGRSDRAAGPSGSQCRPSPWTWRAGSLTDRSEGCNNPSAAGTDTQHEL